MCAHAYDHQNQVRSMFVTAQPDNFYIGTVEGDELAIMTPQPQVFFADAWGNPTLLPTGAEDAVMAQLCFDPMLSNVDVSMDACTPRCQR